MECKNCAYYWKEESDRFASCHFEPLCADDYPPCEQEDIDRQREADEAEYEANIEE